MNELIQKMIEYDAGDPRRIQHFLKVYTFAKLIGEEEKLSAEELRILSAAAIVHDIGIHEAEKRYGNCNGKLQEELGPNIARAMLMELGYETALIDRVCYLVGHHHTYKDMEGMDYQILVEADFLVNLYEDEVAKQAVEVAKKNIFRTGTGIRILNTMFA